MTEQEALRVAERAEGLYHTSIMYAAGKEHAAELRFRATRDAMLTGQILGKNHDEVLEDIETFKEADIK